MCTAPECYMSEHAPRPQRSCVRCGRRGRNAFRRIMVEGLEGGWLCSHEATCVSRARLRARRRLKDPSTDERALPLFVKPVAVMGRDPRGVALIEQILTEFAGIDVDPLDASPSAMAHLTHREYDAVVIDLARTDPVGYVSDLARRLTRMRARGVAMIVCCTPGVRGPALESLIDRAEAGVVERPFDVGSLIRALASAAGGGVEWRPPAWLVGGAMPEAAEDASRRSAV